MNRAGTVLIYFSQDIGINIGLLERLFTSFYAILRHLTTYYAISCIVMQMHYLMNNDSNTSCTVLHIVIIIENLFRFVTKNYVVFRIIVARRERNFWEFLNTT